LNPETQQLEGVPQEWIKCSLYFTYNV